MPNPHNNNHDSFSVDPVNHAIIADSNPKMVGLSLKFLAARRKRIFAERGNFLRDPALKLLSEVSEFAGSGRREFENIVHVQG
jgi:hypothetical protein